MSETATVAGATTADPLVALRSRTGVALIAATVLASMVTFLDANVVNVAVPAIGRDLGTGVAGLQWALTGYLLSVAALLLLAGALADRFGRRRILAIGLLAMLVASVLCAIAPSVGALIAARILQGAGSALVVPTSLALLNAVLRVPDRATGIGVWVAPLTAGVLAAVSDADLGEASAINDAAARLGGLLAIAAVPILVGVSMGGGLADALVGGYRPAMLVLAGVCGLAALVTAGFVGNQRPGGPVPRVVPAAPHHGCAPAVL
jgi:MFS family permease